MGVEPELWRGKRVLVTGHTGFKGSWLSLWLASMGARVTGLSIGVPTKPSLFELARIGDEVESHEADIRDFEHVRDVIARTRPEFVFHLAAQPLVQRSFRDPRTTYEVNVMGTVNVLEAVRDASDVRVLINITSDKCYERGADTRPHREDDAKGGDDPYSSSKASAELVTHAYRHSFFSGGEVAVASARAGNVIGGGDWAEDRLVPDLVRAVAAGRPAQIRNPDAVRPWQHVLNPLGGYLLLAQELSRSSRAVGGWNFGPEEGDAKPVRWLLERLRAAWGDELTWVDADAGHLPERATLLLDSSRARIELGWRPAWDLEETVGRTVRWYRAAATGEDPRKLSLEEIESFMLVPA